VSVPRAEIALIGSLLIDPDAADAVAALVGAEDFASARWREVYAAATALRLRGIVVDYVTVCDELERRGTLASVDEANLTAAINCCPCSVHALSYARQVAQAATDRIQRGREGYALPRTGGLVE
jgi:replicative DNA helicase